MDVWIWVVLVGVAGVGVSGVWWKRHARRVYVIDHVRVEVHPVHIVEDRLVEQVWRAAISMTNTSRRPRALPVLAERATARAGRRVYLASIYLETDAAEMDPGAVALAWIESVHRSGESPRAIDVQLLSRRRGMAFVLPLTPTPFHQSRVLRRAR